MMNQYSHAKPNYRNWILAIVLLIPLAAQCPRLYGQQSAPALPAESTHSRKPELRELYAMFFNYAVHVDKVADTDEKAGKDRKFYRQHLQTASSLTKEEYEQVLAAAKRFVAADTVFKSQISDAVQGLKSTGSQPKSRLQKGQSTPLQITLNGIQYQRASALSNAIMGLRYALGSQTADELESYLQNKYGMGHLGPAPAKNYTLQPKSKQIQATPETVGFNSGSTCDTYTNFDEDSYMTICSDAQIAYLGNPESDLVEFYASMSANGDDPNGMALTGYSVEGDFYVDGEEHDNLDCDSPDGETTCSTNVLLTSGNGASYDWVAIGYATWDFDDECDGFCDDDDGNHESAPASVTIDYPDIASISPPSLTAGSSGSGTLVIDGEGLISPFQNQPTVTVTNQSSIFSSFRVQSFNYEAGTITIDYTLLPNPFTGIQTVTVNNGFGTGNAELPITPGNPNITGIAVNGVSSAPLLGGATQIVTLTGSNFGTPAPTISSMGGVTGLGIGTPSAPTGTGTNQTVSFSVTVPISSPASTIYFELHVNDGAQNPNANSPSITLAPAEPVQPIILDLLASDNNYNCAGENIGQGVASAQQVVVGQLVSFTACVPQAGFEFGGLITASWSSTPNSLSLYGVQNYVLSNYTPYPSGYVGAAANSTYPASATVTQLVDSPPCYSAYGGASNFCDFQTFAFVNPGVYDITFSYNLGNGTQDASTTIEYIVTGPTNSPNCVMSGVSCAFSPAIGNTRVTILAPGTDVGGSPLVQYTMYAGNPLVYGASALDVIVSAGSPESTPGAFQWVQEITGRAIQYINPQGIPCNDCIVTGPALDNVYPYPGQAGRPQEAVDNPGIALYNKALPELYEVSDKFKAQMYLLWDPELNADGTNNPGCAASTQYRSDGTFTSKTSTCTGSIPIPLGSLNWGYCGTAVNTLGSGTNGWVLSCPVGGVPDVVQTYISPSGSSSYPTWTNSSVYLNQNH